LTLFTLFDATRLQISNAQNDLFSPLKQLSAASRRTREKGDQIPHQEIFSSILIREHTEQADLVGYDEFQGKKLIMKHDCFAHL
jgi:hypothetical protein